MLILMLLLCGLFALICYSMGVKKGYSGVLCVLAGFFGNVSSIVILALLPDVAAEQEQRDQEARRHREEIEALKRRIAELEAVRKAEEPEATEVRKVQDVQAVQPESADGEKDAMAPAVFRSRTLEIVECPKCGRRQQSCRDNCYNCGTPFLYQDEL